MIDEIIKEMEKVDILNITGENKKKMVLDKFKKDLGQYYNYNSFLLSSTIDFISKVSKSNFNTTLNNNNK
jgi:hypothetical protein|tara:strand:- start:732 stop:941 length:210 start_codon:yes stop_codon:yes gene_type:complete